VLSLRSFPLLVVVAVFAACQPLPQPFQADRHTKATNALIRPVGDTSLFVTPIAGLPDGEGRAMAEALAAALTEKDIPASATTRNRLSSVLTVTVEPRAGDLLWSWIERNPDNNQLGEAARPLGIGVARLSDPAAIRQAARTMATSISASLNDVLAASAPADTGPAKLAVQDCIGAPGDGNRSLRQAMRELLILAGQAPLPAPEGADYVIGCEVKVWQDGPDSERVTIEWFLQGTDGGRLGEVRQGNRIPRGQLARAWGNTAHIIAQGGWQGLSEIIETRRRGKPVLRPVKS
jgi:hypothetical protein